jgi:RNA polymerase sigma-70 factor (ECF subfamily)
MTLTTNDHLDGDRHDEFLRLFSRCSGRIYTFILTLVMRDADADEIFQDTSLVLWKKFGTFEPDGNFYSWACRIAYIEVLRLRQKNRRLQIVSDEALSVLAEIAIDRADDLDARTQALEHCLEKLGGADRLLIEQRYHQQLTPKEIAAASARSVYAVYRALARVHTALLNCIRRQLAREG